MWTLNEIGLEFHERRHENLIGAPALLHCNSVWEWATDKTGSPPENGERVNRRAPPETGKGNG